ncbi:LysR family transcriptional regulator [Novosphingobium sp. 9U]|uniref:LysR family transcriptional regulator n=1 Tax=Novosphingobium sp. 9U TaxID=2653158 RepID=UPI0012EFC227|nr:LysR family transcriptional regulator [Novosphingobium sp. 9U]VWX51448.1 putative SDS degradation transcriptional activation protein [Novosphingobium sp. 9U]
MDTRKLRHAVTLSRVLNFTRAAQQLNITQSALSRSIQALESECRLQLFDRTRGMVALTQAGHEFIRHAEALLRNENALRNILEHAADGEGGAVTLGVTPLVARIFLGPVLAARVQRPHFHAEVVLGGSKQILSMVARETIDLGICRGDPLLENTHFATVPLAQLPLSIIVRRGHPLTAMAEFTARDVEEFPLIRSSHHSFDQSDASFLGMVRNLPPAVTMEDYGLLNRIVATSDAVWVTSALAAEPSLQNGELARLPIGWLPDASISLSAYALAGRTLSPLAQSMLDEFRAIGATLSA